MSGVIRVADVRLLECAVCASGLARGVSRKLRRLGGLPSGLAGSMAHFSVMQPDDEWVERTEK